jgi:micrococcal nuclease
MNQLDERIAAALEWSAHADIQQEADCRRDSSSRLVAAKAQRYSFVGKILRVHDGDTIAVQGEKDWPQWWQVIADRLLGIDTPELKDKRPEIRLIAEQARIALTKLTPVGSDVFFDQVSPDKYGNRLLGVPIVNGVDCCKELLRLGLAKPYSGRGVKPWGAVTQ